MKKEELVKLGLEEDMAQKVADSSAEELKGYIPKSRFDEVNEAKKTLENDIRTRDTQLEDLKKSAGDVEGLKSKISELQTANDTAKAEYENKIKQMKIDSAVDMALINAKARNVKAAKALLNLENAELDGEKVLLGRRATDDEADVVGRAGCRAEALHLLHQERQERALVLDGGLGHGVEVGLVGGSAALGDHDEAILVALHGLDVNLCGEVAACVDLVVHV